MNKRDAVLAILENHIQIERNKRCTCGWRPTYKPGAPPFPEYAQHREHLADEITAALS